MEANVSLGELQQKIKRLEGLCQVSIGKINAVKPLHHGYLGEKNDNKKIPCYIFFLGTKEKWKFNQNRERPVERSSHS